jgi:long-chain acyl-CoA synthetase
MANLADHLFRQARDNGDKLALVFEDERWTFARLAERVARVAGGLRAQGVGPGTRIALMCSSRPDFIVVQQAIYALGATLIPLNIFYRRADLAHALTCCGVEVLVLDGEFVERLPDAADLPELRLVLAFGGAVAGAEPAEALADCGAPLEGPVDMPSQSVGMMLNTSATTGRAKGVMLSIANLQANYDPTAGWLGLDRDSVILCALPLYNTFGLNQGINATMVTGCTLVLMARFDADACLDAIAHHRCTFLPMVPTMLQRIVDHPDADRHDLSSVSRILTGAAPVPAALLERIYKVIGANTVVMTAYGLTEASAIVTLEHITLSATGQIQRPKSIGRVLPGMELHILREDGTPCDAGEVGEISVRGPNVMLGYFRDPVETAKALRDGWLRTGDLGVFDAKGDGYIVDRKKDVIIRGGQNVYPVDIEDVLYHVPGVREVAVIGEPHEALGQVPVAFVSLKPGSTVSADALMARCKEELAYYKVPRSIHILDDLPKGPTGKILRRGLRVEFQPEPERTGTP